MTSEMCVPHHLLASKFGEGVLDHKQQRGHQHSFTLPGGIEAELRRPQDLLGYAHFCYK